MKPEFSLTRLAAAFSALFLACMIETGHADILFASDGQESDQFGFSVSVSGDRIIVGANAKNVFRGGFYIYQYENANWNQTAIFSLPDSSPYDEFGNPNSVSGNNAIVGAYGKDSYQGGIHMYQYDGTNWNERVLYASDGQANDQFGFSVSVSGNNAIVGAVNKDDSQGGAYIYQYDGTNWKERILSASDGQADDQFGISVSVSGDNAIVGAYGKNNYQGGAYIYQYDGSNWNEIILSESNGQANDLFGISVSLDPDGDRFAIGGVSQKVYTNTVGALTTFNKGSHSEKIEGINFTSPMD